MLAWNGVSHEQQFATGESVQQVIHVLWLNVLDYFHTAHKIYWPTDKWAFGKVVMHQRVIGVGHIKW